jgi:hypothetical protein
MIKKTVKIQQSTPTRYAHLDEAELDRNVSTSLRQLRLGFSFEWEIRATHYPHTSNQGYT